MIPIQPYFLNTLVQILINQYFSHLNCLNFVSDDKMIIFESDKPIIVYNLSESYNISLTLFHFGCHGFIIHTNKPRYMLENIEHRIRFTTTTKFHERRYLFIPTGEFYRDEIFLSINLEYVADVLVIASDVDGVFDLWSHKFVGLTDHRKMILMDRWFQANQSFLLGANCYPDKIGDQKGRVLRLNTFDYKPYINVDTEHGFELMMAKTYAEHHNMSYSIKVEPEFWGVFFFNNLTATGAKWTLWSDQVDLSIAQWYSLPDYTNYFDLTESTVRIGVTMLVPGPELAGGWLTPLSCFPNSVWWAFLLSTIGIIVVYFIFDYVSVSVWPNEGEGPQKLPAIVNRAFVIVVVTMYLQQPLNIIVNQKGSYLRQMFAILLFSSILFATTYTAGFASILTIPKYTRGIENTFDFAASGLSWGAIHTAILDGFKEVSAYKPIVDNLVVLSNDEIRRRMHVGNFAMMVERVRTGLVVSNRIDYMDLTRYRVLFDDLYQVYCVMLVKRSSILIPSIRKLFLTMKEAGLPLFWEEMAFQEENYQAITALRYAKKETPVVELQWMHIQGAFLVLWLGLAISAIAFLVEVLPYKAKRKNAKLFDTKTPLETKQLKLK